MRCSQLAGDLDALLAGLLAERLGATTCSGGALRVGGVRGQIGLGQRADDGDLVAVEVERDGSGEPVLRQASRQPAAEGVMVSAHTEMLT